MKLLCEVADVEYLTEAVEPGKPKNYFIRGVFMTADTKNRNGRIYPMKTLIKEVKKYTTNFIKKNRALGELGHPSCATLNLDKVSHMINELKQDGNNFIGKAKVLDTPNGKIVKALIDEGCTLGISTRGLGSLKQTKEGREVQPDFQLVTAGDLVHDPSNATSFLENMMEETEWVMQAGNWVPRYIEDAKPRVDEAYAKKNREEREKIAQKLFEEFLAKIKN